MKISKMKNKIFLVFTLTLFFVLPLSVFAHETEVVHEEAIPTISPVFLIGIMVVLAIGGFLLWKFVLASPKKTTPSQEKSASQSDESNVS